MKAVHTGWACRHLRWRGLLDLLPRQPWSVGSGAGQSLRSGESAFGVDPSVVSEQLNQFVLCLHPFQVGVESLGQIVGIASLLSFLLEDDHPLHGIVDISGSVFGNHEHRLPECRSPRRDSVAIGDHHASHFPAGLVRGEGRDALVALWLRRHVTGAGGKTERYPDHDQGRQQVPDAASRYCTGRFFSIHLFMVSPEPPTTQRQPGSLGAPQPYDFAVAPTSGSRLNWPQGMRCGVSAEDYTERVFPLSDQEKSSLAAIPSPGSGWHPDPLTPGQLRWNDGSQWTGRIRRPAARQSRPSTTSDDTSPASNKSTLIVPPTQQQQAAIAEANAAQRLRLVTNASIFGLLMQILGGIVAAGGLILAIVLYNQASYPTRVAEQNAATFFGAIAVVSGAVIAALGYIVKLLAAMPAVAEETLASWTRSRD